LLSTKGLLSPGLLRSTAVSRRRFSKQNSARHRDRFATTSRDEGAFAVFTARSSAARRYLKRLLRYDVKTNVRARGRVIDAQRLLKSEHESSFHGSACKYQPGIRHGFSLAVSSAVTTAGSRMAHRRQPSRECRRGMLGADTPPKYGCFVSQVVWLVSRTR